MSNKICIHYGVCERREYFKDEDCKDYTPVRPRGEWLDIYSSHIAYECSTCYRQMPITDEFKFCPFCGSFNVRGKKK